MCVTVEGVIFCLDFEEKKLRTEWNKVSNLRITRCLELEETVTRALFLSETTLWLSGRVFPPHYYCAQILYCVYS